MAEFEINYEALAQDALRGVVRRVLMHAATNGLPGEHHFYISFATGAPGVSVSKRLRQLHPDDMTIVLQHQFWDLKAEKEHFEVKLSFNGRTEQLVVPNRAIKMFYDPSVPYGLQFETAAGAGTRTRADGQGTGADARGGAGGEGRTLGELFADAKVAGEAQDDGPRGPRVATSMGERIGGEPAGATPSRGKGRRRDGKNADELLGEALDDALDTLRTGTTAKAAAGENARGGEGLEDAEAGATPDGAQGDDKPTATVVSLDAFRKK